MTQVYLGLRNASEGVAVKVLKDLKPDNVQLFKKEIALLKLCRHQNVVQFLGAVVTPTEVEPLNLQHCDISGPGTI